MVKSKKDTECTSPCMTVTQGDRSFILSRLPAETLTEISYAAVRRQDDEAGAVQRVLDAKRIADLKQFTLSGGHYPACIILNWVSEKYPLSQENGNLTFTVESRLAQIVDGQHRVEGMRAAIKVEPSIAKMEIPVAIYDGLSTRDCADIFLSINDKQRRVPKSLVVDLFGEASDYVVDADQQRARDLGEMLHEDEESPYQGRVRFPTDASSKLGISLSTIVSTIKPLVESAGIFMQVGLVELYMQRACLFNFFRVLSDWYGKRWHDRSNVFMSSAGFVGAIDFLKLDMIPHCNLKKDYSKLYMNQAMDLEADRLIDKVELKGLQGRASWNRVRELLKDRFLVKIDSRDIKF